jgi:hypothetical protein
MRFVVGLLGVAVLAACSGDSSAQTLADFDSEVIDLHDEYRVDRSIGAFHETVQFLCSETTEKGDWFDSLSPAEQTALDASMAHCGAVLQPGQSASLPADADSWEAAISVRWGRIVWWHDEATFSDRAAELCRLPADARGFPDFSATALRELFALLRSGECDLLPEG